MKVGILGTRGIPNNYGGFEQFAQQLSQGLVLKGHDVYVYSSSDHPYQEKSWNGVHIIHCIDREKTLGTAGQFFYDLQCNKDAASRNFDVLFHFGYSSDAIWWRKWPKHTRNIVNMDGLEWKRTKYNALTRKFLKRSEAWAAKHADILIADSTGIRDYLKSEYGKPSVYIPYGAEIFENMNPSILNKFKLNAHAYYLVLARMEPENNIDMIIRGFIASGSTYPLIIIGNIGNKYGKWLSKIYSGLVRFEGPIYDQQLLNNLRAFSQIYFHGHSVGGTNPSLLEAMACGCRISAHDNEFNRSVLGLNADYFSNFQQVAYIINSNEENHKHGEWAEVNKQKILNDYAPQKIIDAYESLIIN